jgi:hypothetical protein
VSVRVLIFPINLFFFPIYLFIPLKETVRDKASGPKSIPSISHRVSYVRSSSSFVPFGFLSCLRSAIPPRRFRKERKEKKGDEVSYTRGTRESLEWSRRPDDAAISRLEHTGKPLRDSFSQSTAHLMCRCAHLIQNLRARAESARVKRSLRSKNGNPWESISILSIPRRRVQKMHEQE